MARRVHLRYNASSPESSTRLQLQDAVHCAPEQTAVTAPSILTVSSLESDRTTSALDSPASSRTSFSVSGNANLATTQNDMARKTPDTLPRPTGRNARPPLSNDSHGNAEDPLKIISRSGRACKPTEKALELAVSGGKFYASLKESAQKMSSPESEAEASQSYSKDLEPPAKVQSLDAKSSMTGNSQTTTKQKPQSESVRSPADTSEEGGSETDMQQETPGKANMLRRKRKATLLSKKASPGKRTKNTKRCTDTSEGDQQRGLSNTTEMFQEDITSQEVAESEHLSTAKTADDIQVEDANLASSNVSSPSTAQSKPGRRPRGRPTKRKLQVTGRDSTDFEEVPSSEVPRVAELKKPIGISSGRGRRIRNKVTLEEDLDDSSDSPNILNELHSSPSLTKSASTKDPAAIAPNTKGNCGGECLDGDDFWFAIAEVGTRMSHRELDNEKSQITEEVDEESDDEFRRLLREYCQCPTEQQAEDNKAELLTSESTEKTGKIVTRGRKSVAREDISKETTPRDKIQHNTSAKEAVLENASDFVSPRRLKLNPPKPSKIIKLKVDSAVNEDAG